MFIWITLLYYFTLIFMHEFIKKIWCILSNTLKCRSLFSKMSVATVASKFPTEIPGWLGSLVLSFDGGILFSAGDLTDDLDSAPKFVELARHLGVYMTLVGAPSNRDNPFRRFTSRFFLSRVIIFLFSYMFEACLCSNSKRWRCVRGQASIESFRFERRV